MNEKIVDIKIVDILKDSYIKTLESRINKVRKADTPIHGVDEVLLHLELLAKPITRYGENVAYLPIDVKKMIAFIVSPLNHFDYEIAKGNDSDGTPFVTVVARFYWDDSEMVSGTGRVTLRPKDIRKSDFLSEQEREYLLEPTAIGSAESRALTNAGIGLQLYYGDSIDPDVFRLLDKSVSPTVQEETKNASVDSKDSKESPSNVPTAHVTGNPIPNKELPNKSRKIDLEQLDIDALCDEVEENTVSTKPELEPKSTMEPSAPKESDNSLNEAFNVVVDDSCASLCGNSLRDIYNAKPRKLIYIAEKSKDKTVVEAALKIIYSDSTLAGYMKN